MSGSVERGRCPACGLVASFRPSRDPDFIRCGHCDVISRSDANEPFVRQAELDRAEVAPSSPPPVDMADYETERRFLSAYGATQPGSNALDIGCGSGGFLACLSLLGLSAIGLEAGSATAAAARSFGFDVRLGRLTDEVVTSEFTQTKFDLVSFRESLYYVDDLPSALHALQRVAKPGAYLHVKCHVADSPFYWNGARYMDRVGSFAQCMYSRSSLMKVLSFHGFEIVATRAIALTPNALSLFGRTATGLSSRIVAKALTLLPPDRILVLTRFPG